MIKINGLLLKLLFLVNIGALLSSYVLSDSNLTSLQVSLVLVSITLCNLLLLFVLSRVTQAGDSNFKLALQHARAKDYGNARSYLQKPIYARFFSEQSELHKEFNNTITQLESCEKQISYISSKINPATNNNVNTALPDRNALIRSLYIQTLTEHVGLFSVKVDGLMLVNENLGHDANLTIQHEVTERLKSFSNKYLSIYAASDSEYFITYSPYSNNCVLRKMANAIIDLFNIPFEIRETQILLNVSIGIGSTSQHSETSPEELISRAEIAMHLAKKEGKNRLKVFDETMRSESQTHFTIKNDFLSGLNNKQFFIVYQPIIDAKDRNIVKLEALCRWNHPDLGNIAPLTFIGVIEENETMNTLFDWITNEVMLQLKRLEEMGLAHIVISINISPTQLNDFVALELLKDKIDTFQVNPNRIELELTETTLITNYLHARNWLKLAKSLGLRIAIDDFGAGYSSLSYLTSFDYDTVKLDRSLLDKVDVDTKQQRIISSLTQMMHGLEIPIVAEGAETKAQLDMLFELGCDFIQGFHISHPIQEGALPAFLEQYSHTTMQ